MKEETEKANAILQKQLFEEARKKQEST